MDRKQALNLVGPRQAVVVSCRGVARLGTSKKEVQEAILVTSHMLASYEPFLYAIALDRGTAAEEIITQSKVFAVNFVRFSHVEGIEKLHEHPFSGDKLTRAGFEADECQAIDCPRLRDCPAFLECEVVERLSFGSRTVFFGKVVRAEHLTSSHRLLHDPDAGYVTTVKHSHPGGEVTDDG